MTIEYTFPIRGHSFLPADRVFGRIEQEIRRRDTILLPQEYINILRNHGNVHVYGTNWQCRDYKAAARLHCKFTRSFKISDGRVLKIDGKTLGHKRFFSQEFTHHNILKRGKSWDTFDPHLMPMINCVNDAKRSDVLKLLSEIGADMTVTQFYQDALAIEQSAEIGAQDLEESSDES